MPSRFRGPLLGSSSAYGGALQNAPADFITQREYDIALMEFTTAEEVNVTTGWVRTAIGAAAADTFVLRTAAGDMGSFVIVNAGTANSTGVQYNRTNHIDSIPVNNNAGRTVEWGWGARLRLDDADGGSAFAGLEASGTPSAVLDTAGAVVASIALSGFHMTPSGTSAQIATVSQSAAGNLAPSVVSGELLSNDEWVHLGMYGAMKFTANAWTGGYMQFFVNGGLLQTVRPADFAANPVYAAATGGYRHTLAAVNGAAAVIDMEVDLLQRWFVRQA